MGVDHFIDIIQPLSGIQRDGTQFSSENYIDGQWCRWYRGRPKKIGGYTLIDPGTPEIIRNLYEVNKTRSVDIYIGRPSSLVVANSTLTGIVAPENDRTPANFMVNPDNIWTFDKYTDVGSTTITLANNPLATTNGSNIVTVTVSNTSVFYNNQVIIIAGATTVGGLTTAQLNISAEITIINGTTFTYLTTGTPASSTVAAGGGNAVTLAYNSNITYIMAHAAPNASAINNDIQTNIYWGNINSNAALTLIDPVNLPVSSSGLVVNYPYVFIYGNNGIVTYTLTPNNWSTAVSTAIASTKIIKGIKIRGGGNSPAFLFFSMDSVVRATFQGGTPPFNFDTLQYDTSIMSQNCIVTNFNIVYWIGVDQFYLYNGVVRPLENNMSTDYFFDNINMAYRNKVFSWLNGRYNEWWIHWPKGQATECTDILIYNYKENVWYDSVLGRTAVCDANYLPRPILSDSTTVLNKFNPTVPVSTAVPNNALATVMGSSTIKVTLGFMTNLQSGNIVTISGATTFGGISAPNLNVTSPIVVTSFPNTPTVFTYTAGTPASSTVAAGGGNVIFYTQILPNECYGIWQHETGTDMGLYSQTFAIQAYFETNIKTLFEKDPSQDRNLRIRRIEPDFTQIGEMTLTINYRSFAQSTVYASESYTFLPGQEVVELAKIDTTQMGRLVSFRFESNIQGGFFEGGKILLNYAPGDVRP